MSNNTKINIKLLLFHKKKSDTNIFIYVYIFFISTLFKKRNVISTMLIDYLNFGHNLNETS